MKRIAAFILLAVVLLLMLGIHSSFGREKEESLDTTKIMQKLDEVLANQEKMLKQFEEIKQELAVIKVRASR